MKSKEMYEALLAHLANASQEVLAEDWEALKTFNCGVTISDYMETVASMTELEVLCVTSNFDGMYSASTCEGCDMSLAA